MNSLNSSNINANHNYFDQMPFELKCEIAKNLENPIDLDCLALTEKEMSEVVKEVKNKPEYQTKVVDFQTNDLICKVNEYISNSKNLIKSLDSAKDDDNYIKFVDGKPVFFKFNELGFFDKLSFKFKIHTGEYRKEVFDKFSAYFKNSSTRMQNELEQLNKENSFALQHIQCQEIKYTQLKKELDSCSKMIDDFNCKSFSLVEKSWGITKFFFEVIGWFTEKFDNPYKFYLYPNQKHFDMPDKLTSPKIVIWKNEYEVTEGSKRIKIQRRIEAAVDGYAKLQIKDIVKREDEEKEKTNCSFSIKRQWRKLEKEICFDDSIVSENPFVDESLQAYFKKHKHPMLSVDNIIGNTEHAFLIAMEMFHHQPERLLSIIIAQKYRSQPTTLQQRLDLEKKGVNFFRDLKDRDVEEIQIMKCAKSFPTGLDNDLTKYFYLHTKHAQFYYGKNDPLSLAIKYYEKDNTVDENPNIMSTCTVNSHLGVAWETYFDQKKDTFRAQVPYAILKP